MKTSAQERARNATLARVKHARIRRHRRYLDDIEQSSTFDRVTTDRMAGILRSIGYTVSEPWAAPRQPDAPLP